MSNVGVLASRPSGLKSNSYIGEPSLAVLSLSNSSWSMTSLWFDSSSSIRAQYVEVYITCPFDLSTLLVVEKLPLSLILIYCRPEIFNSPLALTVSFLKIACLHASFTAYENFYKLSKMHCPLIWFSTFKPSEVPENRDPTIKHISTYTLNPSLINIYVIDFFRVILFTY